VPGIIRFVPLVPCVSDVFFYLSRNIFHFLQYMYLVASFAFYLVWSSPCTGLDRPSGIQEVKTTRFRHTKVARLSAVRTSRLYPPGNIPGNHFC
jgi:hypothetical protein